MASKSKSEVSKTFLAFGPSPNLAKRRSDWRKIGSKPVTLGSKKGWICLNHVECLNIFLESTYIYIYVYLILICYYFIILSEIMCQPSNEFKARWITIRWIFKPLVLIPGPPFFLYSWIILTVSVATWKYREQTQGSIYIYTYIYICIYI